MRAVLRAEPELAGALGGDVAGNAIDLLLQSSWKDNKLVGDAIRERLRAMSAELEGANPTAIERGLAQRISACWLHLAHAESIYATNMAKANHRTLEALEDARDRAHRRYLSAIKALAQVRRLLVPMVQVNVAERQMVANVGK